MPRERPLYEGRIVCDPNILVGKPTIKGTRISVELVLDYLSRNPNLDELFADYPHLTMADVQACLAYGQMLVAQKGRRLVRKTLAGASGTPA